MSPDGNWGAPVNVTDLTGRWNGMVGEVAEGRADFGHAPFSTSLERSRVITYGIPIEEDMCGRIFFLTRRNF